MHSKQMDCTYKGNDNELQHISYNYVLQCVVKQEGAAAQHERGIHTMHEHAHDTQAQQHALVVVVVVIVVVVIVVVSVFVIISACSSVWSMVHLGCVWSGQHAMEIHVTHQHHVSLVGPASN